MNVDLLATFRGPVSSWRLEPVIRSVPAALYMVLIHVVSSVEGRKISSFAVDDRIAHYVEYFILGVLLVLALSAFDRKGRPWRIAVFVIALAALYGAIDEYHQSFVAGRVASVKDLGFDVAGASTSALLIRWLAWRERT